MQQRRESETQADEGQVFEDETSYLQGRTFAWSGIFSLTVQSSFYYELWPWRGTTLLIFYVFLHI